MKFLNYNIIREYSIFIFLIILVIVMLIIHTIYSNSKTQNLEKLNSSLNNTYLKKTVQEITNNLKPRFTYYEYSSKSGDNHQSIIDKLDISKKKKKKNISYNLKWKKIKNIKYKSKI